MRYREHEPVIPRGKAEPVRAWEVVEARSRFGVGLSSAIATVCRLSRTIGET